MKNAIRKICNCQLPTNSGTTFQTRNDFSLRVQLFLFIICLIVCLT